ncbi:hypothetical protein EYZ11_012472 [Aspergillus tanneri]|uniref:HTH psq-type domain-containing protein n=1 Tax=Aspergillus tanneri TaxID=1220188 RepID=A0A4S3J5J4_9EURO|nr:hypothetical protein EYZ11_012472 [Aspergillus tanneri]
MPRSTGELEKRVLEACKAASKEKKPNLAKIAREYGVLYNTLRGHVYQGKQARNAHTPQNKALDKYQEKALVQWIASMRDLPRDLKTKR